MAYQDVGNSNKATVMKYNGTSWENIGNAGFSDGMAGWSSLFVYNGIPYAAYTDWGNSKKATVMNFTN